MISKKSRKVVAALLIGATVCASGTFAYFNSVDKLDTLFANKDKAALDITNGKVKITGKINGVQSATQVWAYDVSRLSELNDPGLNDTAKAAIGFTATTQAAALSMTSDSTYVQKNVSPDILGLASDGSRSTTKAAVGDYVTGSITKARPGDAFVLGGLVNDGTNGGIIVVNESNLTTKIGIVPTTGTSGDVDATTGTEGAKKQLKALKDAGWKLYMRIIRIDKDGNELQDDGTVASTPTEYTEYTETNIDTIVGGLTLKDVKPGQSVRINVRVELPLGTTNSYQEKTTSSTELADGFDLSKLFDVVVTQENNPGWNQDGTSTSLVSDQVTP